MFSSVPIQFRSTLRSSQPCTSAQITALSVAVAALAATGVTLPAAQLASLNSSITANPLPQPRIPVEGFTQASFTATFAPILVQVGGETNAAVKSRWDWYDNMLSKLTTVTVTGLTNLGVFAEMITDGYAANAALALIAQGVLPAGTTGQQLIQFLCTTPDPKWSAQVSEASIILGTPDAAFELSDIAAANAAGS